MENSSYFTLSEQLQIAIQTLQKGNIEKLSRYCITSVQEALQALY
ncbi:hypothetical protein [Campylobacter hyointestinalis]|nr:hypothetical protein [Campylobacter hyointestinalis]